MHPAPNHPLTLAQLPQVGVARVVSVTGTGLSSQRLKELGFTPGTEISFCRQAPFGGPLVVSLRGYHLCLRTREAKNILIESVGRVE